MAVDTVTPIPTNQHVDYWNHWEVYDITPIFSEFYENFPHDKNIRLYDEEVKK